MFYSVHNEPLFKNAPGMTTPISKMSTNAAPDHLQMYMPTSDDIRKRSVLTVEENEDLLSNKLGVNDWDTPCATCDCDLNTCPGHDGVLELPIPVFRVLFMKRLIQILNCVCFYCQRLRLPREDPSYKWIATLPMRHRLEYLVQHSRAYKWCGQVTQGTRLEDADMDMTDEPCNEIEYCYKPYFVFKNEDRDAAFPRAVIPLTSTDLEAFNDDPDSWLPYQVTPQRIIACLRSIETDALEMLGCTSDNLPETCMWEVLNVPSINTRPNHVFDGVGARGDRAHNDWTKFLQKIVHARNDLREVMERSTEAVVCSHYEFKKFEHYDHRKVFKYGGDDSIPKSDATKIRLLLKKRCKLLKGGAVNDKWRTLNCTVAAFHSVKHKKLVQNGNTYGKPLNNVDDRFRLQKAGRFRANIIARRINNAGRGVLEGDIHIRLNEVCIPRTEAMNLVRKVAVTPYNLSDVQTWIINGPYTYPGANYVVLKDGTELSLLAHPNRRDLVGPVSEVAYVCRHLINGDWMLVGRQPTLHRMSTMSFRAVVTDEFVVRLHYAVFTPLAADCDGDEVNYQIIQDDDAVAEMREICCVENNVMKDGKIWIKFILNAPIAAYIMTAPHIKLNRSQATAVMQDLGVGLPPGVDTFSGHQLISLVLPSMMSCQVGDVVIERGVLVKGRLNESVLNGENGILAHMYRDCADKTVVTDFIYKGYIMWQRFLDIHGHSAGYYDACFSTNDVAAQPSVVERLARLDTHIGQLVAYTDTLPTFASDAVEESIREHVDKLNELSIGTVSMYQEHLDGGRCENGILTAINSRAKGSKSTLGQMGGMVGQIYVMRNRVPFVSSHFADGRQRLKSRGFISESYSQGVPVTAMIAESPATAESVVRKNKGTSESGYAMRKLTICLMGVVTDWNKQVRDTTGRVIWSLYGNDGYDPQFMCNSDIRVLNHSESETIRRWACMFKPSSVLVETRESWKAVLRADVESKDKLWLQALKIVDIGGTVVADQTVALDETMTSETLEEWNRIKYSPDMVELMSSEVDTLLELQRRLAWLLSRCPSPGGGTEKIHTVRSPIPFAHMLERCRADVPPCIGGKSNAHPGIFAMFTRQLWSSLVDAKLVVESNLCLKALFLDYFNTRSLLISYRFGIRHLQWLARNVVQLLSKCSIAAGESVGVLATQNIGEPQSQMTLKTPHMSGSFSKVAATVRLQNLIDGKFDAAEMTLVLGRHVKSELDATVFGLSLVRCLLKDILSSYPTYTIVNNHCTITLAIDARKAIERTVSLRAMVKRICASKVFTLEMFTVPYMDRMGAHQGPTGWHLTIRVPMSCKMWIDVTTDSAKHCIRPANVVANTIIANICEFVVNGMPTIAGFQVKEIDVFTGKGKERRWCVVTSGSCFRHAMCMPDVDSARSTTSDVSEMCSVLGMHAARKALENEFVAILKDKTDVRHIQLIARMMASDLVIKGMKIKQIAQNIPPLQRASYEQCVKQLTDACMHAEVDDGSTVCGAAFLNKRLNVGTGYGIDMVDIPRHSQGPTGLAKHICQYVYSPKADGTRYLLCFGTTQDGRTFVSLVNRRSQVFTVGSIVDNAMAGTVLDGELCIVSGTGGRSECFLVFDCLMCCGNKCSVLRYDQRMRIANRLVDGLGDVVTTVTMPKSSVPHNGGGMKLHCLSANLLIGVKPVYDLADVLDEHQLTGDGALELDGVVFTHIAAEAAPFATFGPHGPVRCYKWKPWLDNTIDFVVSFRPNELSQLPGVTTVQSMSEFQSTRGNCWLLVERYNAPIIVFSAAHIGVQVHCSEGDVVECKWSDDDKTWFVVKIRDKKPNTWPVVLKTLENLSERITLDEILITK